MRCLTLADELKNNGYEIIFASRDLPGNNFKEIQERGHHLEILSQTKDFTEKNIVTSFGSTQEDDAEEIKHIFKENKLFDWIIVDHYGLSRNWEIKIKHLKKIIN